MKFQVVINLTSSDESDRSLILLLRALLKRLGRNYKIRCDGIRAEKMEEVKQ